MKAISAMLSMQRKSWEQGVCAQALLEAGLDDALVPVCLGALHYRLPDGRSGMLGDLNGVTDPVSLGPAFLHCHELTGDSVFLKAAEALEHWCLETAPRSAQGLVYHVMQGEEYWSDSLYMLPPFLAIHYPQESMRQFFGWYDSLYLPQLHLLGHRFHAPSGQFTDPLPWGGGNGWALAACPRLLSSDLTPGDHDELLDRFHTLLSAVMQCRKPNGTFPDVLDQPGAFDEVNLCQMTAYAIFEGIRRGHLSDSWLPQALSLQETAHAHTDRFGLVHEVCGAPRFDRSGISSEAQAFSVLMDHAASLL